MISTSFLFSPSSAEEEAAAVEVVEEASLGLLSWSSRCRILWRSVRLLWDAGH